MPTTDINSTTQSNMKGSVSNYSVSSQILDTAGDTGETTWQNSFWAQYLGYYKAIPELKKAIDGLATWSVGLGWTADPHTKVILEHLIGWGEDSFDSILWNMLVVKKINGDAFAEIIRDPETEELINLKPLDPSKIKIVANKKGVIIRYEEIDPSTNRAVREYSPEKIFHICNDRIGSEIHGVSVVEACKWVIDAKNEAMSDWRRILHRSTIRVMYIDADDTTRLTKVKTEYASAIKNGELMLIPAKKGEAEFADLTTPSTQHLEWIRYLDNFFYQAVGVPKVILGGASDYTEAGSKIGFLTFEVPYSSEQRILEQDIWNQLGLKITFNRPPSLKDDVQNSEAANTGQMGFQPNEMMMQVGRTE